MSGGNHTVVVHSRLSAAAIEPLESRTLFNAGILDLSFGFGGATTAASRNIYFRQVVEMPDHKLVAVGNFGSDIGTLAIARYLPNGQPDTTYDGDGLKTFPYQQEQAIGKVVSAVVLPGGGVAVLGSLFRVAKLTADLELDPSFGQGGFAWPFPPNSPTMASVATDLATQADGKIVVTGGSVVPGDPSRYLRPAVVRLNPDGSPDAAFGSGGVARVDFVPGLAPFFIDSVAAVAVRSDGWLVVGCNNVPHGGDRDEAFALLRPNGQIDTSFGVNGIGIPYDGPRGAQSRLAAIRTVPGGGFVTASTDYATAIDHEILASRYNPDGTLDKTFGVNGIAAAGFGGGPLSVIAESVEVQDDGKVVVGGSSQVPNTFQYGYAAARFLINGALDPDFGRGGRTNVEPFPSSAATDMIMTSDGKLVFCGFGPKGTIVVRLLGGSRPNFRAPARQRFAADAQPLLATAIFATPRRDAPPRAMLTASA